MTNSNGEWNVKKQFVVIDVSEKLMSWDNKKECGQTFPTEKAAMARAEELAKSEPHKAFDIYQRFARVFIEVGPIKIER